MLRRNPFGSVTVKPTQVVQVGDRWVWLGAKGAIDPNTNPIDLQQKQKQQADLSVLLFKASRKLADKLGIEMDEAQKLFFAQDGVSEQITNYLSDDEFKEYLALAGVAAEVPIIATTLMIRHRILYDVVVAADAKPKSKQVQILEPWFDLAAGDFLRTPSGGFLKVAEPYDSESGFIGVEPLPQAVKEGETLFLMEFGSRTQLKIGDQSWEDEDTKNLSLETSDGSESQIQAIYKFYLKECGRLAEEQPDAEQSEGKALTSGSQTLSDMPNQNQSTGENSTGESSPTVCEMNGSTPKTLETVRIG